jgi:hypothetical protein
MPGSFPGDGPPCLDPGTGIVRGERPPHEGFVAPGSFFATGRRTRVLSRGRRESIHGGSSKTSVFSMPRKRTLVRRPPDHPGRAVDLERLAKERCQAGFQELCLTPFWRAFVPSEGTRLSQRIAWVSRGDGTHREGPPKWRQDAGTAAHRWAWMPFRARAGDPHDAGRRTPDLPNTSTCPYLRRGASDDGANTGGGTTMPA